MPAPTAPASELARAVAEAGRCPRAFEALLDLYARLDALQAGDGRICLAGGGCCRFDLAGHRLFVTPLELALLVGSDPAALLNPHPQRCAYQSGPRCLARDRRPLGCRTFFCRGPAGVALERCERFHGQIRGLHERFALTYLYVELTGATAAVRRAAQNLPPALEMR